MKQIQNMLKEIEEEIHIELTKLIEYNQFIKAMKPLHKQKHKEDNSTQMRLK